MERITRLQAPSSPISRGTFPKCTRKRSNTMARASCNWPCFLLLPTAFSAAFSATFSAAFPAAFPQPGLFPLLRPFHHAFG